MMFLVNNAIFNCFRYSHWDFIKPSMNVLIDDDDDEEDDLSTISGRSSRSDVMSHLQLPASFNPYTPHVTTSDPLFKKMSVGAKFKLPRMVSTPTPLSPILKEEGVKEEQMDEQKMVHMSPDNGNFAYLAYEYFTSVKIWLKIAKTLFVRIKVH